MTIAAVLSVKDEVELIDRSVDHLRRIGVDTIIACDKGSADGTRERLLAQADGTSMVFTEISDTETHEAWSAMAMDLVLASGCEWVTFLDADEFLVPSTGRLSDCTALDDADVITIRRFNVPATRSGPMAPLAIEPARYDDLLLVAEPIADFWRGSSDAGLSWMYARVAPRVLARARSIRTVGLGGHEVEMSGPAQVVTASDVLVAHVPVSTWSRFERKVENIRRMLAVHDELFGQSRALHWRRWAQQTEEGALRLEFEHLLFDAVSVAELRGRAVVRSAAEVLGRGRP